MGAKSAKNLYHAKISCYTVLPSPVEPGAVLVPACEALVGEERHPLVEDVVAHVLKAVGVQGNL